MTMFAGRAMRQRIGECHAKVRFCVVVQWFALRQRSLATRRSGNGIFAGEQAGLNFLSTFSRGAFMKRFLKAAIAAAFLATSSVSALAGNFSFSGNLAGDNDVELLSFTLASTSDVTLRTWSYAGGTNAVGTLIAAGGFDSIVSLFYGTGSPALLIGANDDGVGVPVDLSTGNAFDSLLEFFALPAGEYTVALSEFDNFANGPTLGDGFLGVGNLNFDGRTSAWALDILGVDSASVSLPGTLALVMLGLAAAGVMRRRPIQVSALRGSA